MKVLHLGYSDLIGGAARAGFRLHQGSRLVGIDSVMLVAKKVGDDPYVFGPSSKCNKVWSRLAPILDKMPTKLLRTDNYNLHSPAYICSCSLRNVEAFAPDIIQLQWICEGFITPEIISKFKRPLVWRLSDMWPFSGAEHYGSSPERYINGYRRNNRPKGERGFDLNRWVWKRKRRVWKSLENLTIVAPSRWLAQCAEKSYLFRNKRIEIIPSGVDIRRFRPLSHTVARSVLGLPPDKILILFGAVSAISDPRKGFGLLHEALQILYAKNLKQQSEIVIFGSSQPRDPPKLGFPVHYLGVLHDDFSLATVYAAADVFVIPSTEDNLPNTALEAMACGTPVVAFNIGGLPDVVIHQENGYLAAPLESTDLAYGISWIIENQERWQYLSAQARKTVEDRFSMDLQVQRYISLYNDIIQNKEIK